MPPNIAPIQRAVDQEALSIALAVIRSSSSTMFGKAARSAVTYTPCNSIINPDRVTNHHISSGPSTRRNESANPTCSRLAHNIKLLRLNLSANNPLTGCEIAKRAILTENKMPRRNSEPEYSRIKKNNAMVLNHSPSNEITEAAHNRLNLALLKKNSTYPLVNVTPPRQSNYSHLSCK